MPLMHWTNLAAAVAATASTDVCDKAMGWIDALINTTPWGE